MRDSSKVVARSRCHLVSGLHHFDRYAWVSPPARASTGAGSESQRDRGGHGV